MFRYQGRLASGTNLVNATLPMSFKLYDAPSDGVLLYEDSSSVPVVDGLYSTFIGDNTVFGSLTNAMTNAAIYLELTVEGKTLSPRERLVSVPYALSASMLNHSHERIITLRPDHNITSEGPITFGKTYVGSTKTLYLFIGNSGDGVVTVTSIDFSDPSFKGDLVWDTESRVVVPPGKIPPYDVRYVEISFTPTLVQEYHEILTVNCDYTSGTNTIACIGTGIASRYIDNGDGTVTDLATSLMWTKNSNHGEMTWSNAVAYCDNLVTNGYSDWRLPSVAQDGGVAELDTLFRESGDPSGVWEKSMGYPFTNVVNTLYWSQTLRASSPGHAWLVNMSYGGMGYTREAHHSNTVWPVRDAK